MPQIKGLLAAVLLASACTVSTAQDLPQGTPTPAAVVDPGAAPVAAGPSLFGVPVAARKLGIMVDVSGSTHPFLLATFRELDRSFKLAPTVLVFGCGAKAEIKPSDFAIVSAARATDEYKKHVKIHSGKWSPDQEKESTETVFGQLAKGASRPAQQELSKYLDQLLKQSNVYWLVADKKVNPRFGSALAMEFLIGQGVDTIYWFSDYDDEFSVEVAEAVTAKLKAKHVRMIAHNFSGIDDPKIRRGLVAAKVIVEGTGGQYISQKVPSR